MNFYESFIRPSLFLLNPEKAHNLIIKILKCKLIVSLFALLYKSDKYNKKFSKNNFSAKNIIGLAAGMDKDAEAVSGFGSLGFGFIEVGTVTPKAQPGNPQPRLLRFKSQKALINRMGFNNNGADEMKNRLKRLKTKDITIGINLGKNKTTPLENAADDYLLSFKKLYHYGDYFVINVSSPNTPKLRELQNEKHLERIFGLLQENNKDNKPLFVKISPELSDEQIETVIDLVKKFKLTGIIATNTSINRDLLSAENKKKAEKFGNGGISGQVLKELSLQKIKFIRQKAGDDILIIGVGGISSAEDINERLEAGADIIQIFTSLIYEGPAIVKKLKKDLHKNSYFK